MITARAFSTKQSEDHPTFDTRFIEPIEDFEFQSDVFAKLAVDLAAQESFPEKRILIEENERLIENLQKKAGAHL